MKVLFTFDGADEHVVAAYWQEGKDVASEVWDPRGSITKYFRNSSLDDVAKNILNGHVDGIETEVDSVKAALHYLGKTPDLIRNLAKKG